MNPKCTFLASKDSFSWGVPYSGHRPCGGGEGAVFADTSTNLSQLFMGHLSWEVCLVVTTYAESPGHLQCLQKFPLWFDSNILHNHGSRPHRGWRYMKKHRYCWLRIKKWFRRLWRQKSFRNTLTCYFSFYIRTRITWLFKEIWVRVRLKEHFQADFF